MPKPKRKQSFDQLQAEWYEKLKQDGFKDVEHKGLLKTWDHFYFQERYTPDTFHTREAYYTLAQEFLNDHPFESTMDRLIWEKHTAGLSVRETVTALTKDGVKTYRDRVHKVVTALKRKMLHRDKQE